MISFVPLVTAVTQKLLLFLVGSDLVFWLQARVDRLLLNIQPIGREP